MCFKGSPRSYPPIVSDGFEFKQVSTAKILAVTFSLDLNWKDHIDNIAVFMLAFFLVMFFIDKAIIVIYFSTHTAAERLEGVNI